MNLKRYIDAAVRREVRRHFRDANIDDITQNIKNSFKTIYESSLKQNDKSDILFGLKKILSLVSKSRLTNNPEALRFAAQAALRLDERLKNARVTTFEDGIAKNRVSANLVSSVYQLKNLATEDYLKKL